MATEAKRGFDRIVANYGRLVLLLALGLIRVPLQIEWVGFEAFGLIAMVGASVGLSGLFERLTAQGLVRDLTAAYHSEDPGAFVRAYNSSYVVAGAIALLSAVVFVVLVSIIHLLNFPREWVGAARWFVASQGVYSCLVILLAPAFSVYRVKEQFGLYAIWMVTARATALTSTIILWFGFGVREPAEAIRLYGILWSGLLCLVYIVAVTLLMRRDRRLVPNLRHIHAADVRGVSHTFTWWGAASVGANLPERLAAVLMNLAFGVFGNAVFEVSLRVVAYVRMATTGVSFGLDSASARLSVGPREGAVRELARHTTRIQSFVALPAGLALVVLAYPLFELWIAQRVENPAEVIPLAVNVSRILALALVCRAIADGWTTILYGAGYVRRFAPILLVAGLLAPAIGAILLFVLPGSWRFYAPAIGYSVVVTVAYFVHLPMTTCRCLDVSLAGLYAPILRPAIVTVLAVPLLIVPALAIDTWELVYLPAVAFIFGLPYCAMTWFVVLSAQERRRFTAAARRRLPGRRQSATG